MKPAPPALDIRRPTPDDVDAVLGMEADPEVMRYSTGVIAPTVARRLTLATYFASPPPDPLGHWIVSSDDEVAGWVSLTELEDTCRVQLAYRLRRMTWGQGIATAAANWACAHAARAGLQALVAVVWPGNTASRRVLEKSGFHFEAASRHYDRDTLLYARSLDSVCVRLEPDPPRADNAHQPPRYE